SGEMLMPEQIAPTSAPRQKVVAATGGSAVGAALSVITFWALQGIFSKAQITIPGEVKDALTLLITTLFTYLAGYYTPPGASEAVVKADDGSMKSATRTTTVGNP